MLVRDTGAFPLCREGSRCHLLYIYEGTTAVETVEPPRLAGCISGGVVVVSGICSARFVEELGWRHPEIFIEHQMYLT